MDFEAYQGERLDRIGSFLARLLPEKSNNLTTSDRLYDAIRYSVLNGGKRMRPLLVYATGEALGHALDLLDAPAAAVELIHCYSLIHDDLPAMDNDDLRRGKPTCHKAFDEATAILAGDAIQALAFEVLADPILNPLPPGQKIKMISLLAQKSGMQGMAGGQALDLAFEGNQSVVSLEHLRNIHLKKTGALIEAAVTLGALASEKEMGPSLIGELQKFARCIGLSFQIQDDILDIISTTEILGKSVGKDSAQQKATFPSRLGLETAKQYAITLHQEALETIGFLEDKDHHLERISALFINRLN